MSKLYIIAGCNGAGKTTASYTVLPEILECREFVNADEIAKGLSPFNPSSVAIEAGRLILKRIGELLSPESAFLLKPHCPPVLISILSSRHKIKDIVSALFIFG